MAAGLSNVVDTEVAIQAAAAMYFMLAALMAAVFGSGGCCRGYCSRRHGSTKA